MRTIGLIGGISWHSTSVYYRRINEHVQERLGGNHSAQLLLYSVDFQGIETAQNEGRWLDLAGQFVNIARTLEQAGADAVAICANTMHKVAGPVSEALRVPLLSILDSTAAALRARGQLRAVLLGTRTTMSQTFYLDGLRARGIEPFVPEPAQQARIHAMIHEEVIAGRILPGTRAELARIIDQLAALGAQAAILGCTELPLLVGPSDTAVPLLDTLEEHASAIAEFALAPQT